MLGGSAAVSPHCSAKSSCAALIVVFSQFKNLRSAGSGGHTFGLNIVEQTRSLLLEFGDDLSRAG